VLTGRPGGLIQMTVIMGVVLFERTPTGGGGVTAPTVLTNGAAAVRATLLRGVLKAVVNPLTPGTLLVTPLSPRTLVRRVTLPIEFSPAVLMIVPVGPTLFKGTPSTMEVVPGVVETLVNRLLVTKGDWKPLRAELFSAVKLLNGVTPTPASAGLVTDVGLGNGVTPKSLTAGMVTDVRLVNGVALKPLKAGLVIDEKVSNGETPVLTLVRSGLALSVPRVPAVELPPLPATIGVEAP